MERTESTTSSLEERLLAIHGQAEPPCPGEMLDLVCRTTGILLSESPCIRPRDRRGLPGGLVNLDPDMGTLLIPDIHGRRDDLLNILLHTDTGERTHLDLMLTGDLQIVCLGDGMHAESRAARRWHLAYDEYLNDYREHDNMDMEMAESFGVMSMVMALKEACPGGFHFLKGNHENISNETGEGNFSFMKIVMEGKMVSSYVRRFYGDEFEGYYRVFERSLPLLAAGRSFLASHAEPAAFFPREELINYRDFPHVTAGLTWTADDTAARGSVMDMLMAYVEEQHHHSACYFGGHRPIVGMYNLRAGGRFIQIHNPDRCLFARIDGGGEFEPDRDIYEIISPPPRHGASGKSEKRGPQR